jgi:hypothetical protein
MAQVRSVAVIIAVLMVLPTAAQSPASPKPRVNGQRLIQHLNELANFGKNPQGGVSRVAYTECNAPDARSQAASKR